MAGIIRSDPHDGWIITIKHYNNEKYLKNGLRDILVRIIQCITIL